MGFFDFFKKGDKKDTTSAPSENNTPNQEKNITLAVALEMQKMKIVSQPIMKYFYNDKGIIEGFIIGHLNDVNFEMIKKQNVNMYTFLLAAHALGAGIYITLCQDKYKKSVDKFTEAEAREIIMALKKTDSYELGIRTLGIPLDGPHKACLDRLCQIGIATLKETCGDHYLEKENLKTLMRVMFNAGITVVMRN